MKRGGLSILAALFVAVASPVHAQPGNGALSGPHFNLNIIGVDKGKKPDMAGTDRHTIFVALGTAGAVEPKKSFIYLVPSAEFAVCDGNAFDAAIDCAGNVIKPVGAVFSLPCNTNISLAGEALLLAYDPPDENPI